MSALSEIFNDTGKTAGPAPAPAAAPAPQTIGQKIGGFFSGMFGGSKPAAPAPASPPASALTSIFSAPSSSATPKTGPLTDIFATPASKSGQGVPSPYFYSQYPSGATIGASSEKDASGKPLLGYRNPGDTSTTTDKTRVATTFDPTKPQKMDPSTFYNPRDPNVTKLRGAMGTAYNQELDHVQPLELSGSNDKANLQNEKTISGTNNTATDPLENSLRQDVASGKKSLVDAQIEMAKAKGKPAPWVPPEYRTQGKSAWDQFKSYVEGLFGVKQAQAATLTDIFKPATSSSNLVPNPTDYAGLIHNYKAKSALLDQEVSTFKTDQAAYEKEYDALKNNPDVTQADIDKLESKRQALVSRYDGLTKSQVDINSMIGPIKVAASDEYFKEGGPTKEYSQQPASDVIRARTANDVNAPDNLIPDPATIPKIPNPQNLPSISTVNELSGSVDAAVKGVTDLINSLDPRRIYAMMPKDRVIGPGDMARITGEIGSAAVKAGMSAIGVIPEVALFTSVLKGSEDLPYVGGLAKVVNSAFGGLSTGGAVAWSKTAKVAVDALPIDQATKDNINNTGEEILGFGAQMLAFLALHDTAADASSRFNDIQESAAEKKANGVELTKQEKLADDLMTARTKMQTLLLSATQSIKNIPSSLQAIPNAQGGFAKNPLAGSGKAPTYEGETDLTTKVLTRLEGRDTVSKQFISDLTNSADLKQQERDIVRSVLEGYTGEVPVKEFAEKVKAELLPLRRSFVGSAGEGTSRYENITLPDEQRGNVANYSEHIYNSPVKTSAGDIHFSQSTSGSGYFGHTRTEDMADGNQEALRKMIKENGQPKTPDDVHKYAGAGGTRRIIEVQSDLYQKGRLEGEAPNLERNSNSNPDIQKQIDTPYKVRYGQTVAERAKDVQRLQQYSNPTAHFRMVREEVKQAAKDGKSTLLFPTGETAMKIEGLGRNNWEISTVDRNGQPFIAKAEAGDLKVGQKISQQRGDDWIVTDVLGDGKFKAVPKDSQGLAVKLAEIASKDKDFLSKYFEPGRVVEGYGGRKDKVIAFNPKGERQGGWSVDVREVGDYQNRNHATYPDAQNIAKYYFEKNDMQAITEAAKKVESHVKESFDLAGDTNNPIYRFYEKDLGRYLANKYGAKPFTDEKGVKWYKVDVKPEQATEPVEAFKKGGKKFGYTRSIEEVKTAIHTVLKEAGIKDPQKAVQLMFSKDFLPKFADGLYQRSINPRLAPLIKIFEEDGKASVFTGIHEAAHFILDPENGLISEAEKKALLDEARKSMTLLQKGYYAARGYRGDKIMEEKIADEWAKQKASERGFHGPLKRALELFDRLVGKVSSAIKKTFEKLNEYLPKENRQGGFAKIPFGDDLNESIAKKKGITKDPRETLKNAEKRAGVKPVLPVKEENISLKADRADRLAANKGTAEMKKIDARTSFADSLKIRLPADLETKATALEIRRQELETSPLNAGLKYIAKNGEFKGRVPEVTGKPGRGDFAQFGDRKLSEITGTSDTEKGREMINDHAAAWKKYEADAVKFKNERQAFLSKARSERDQIIENQKIGRMHEKMDKRTSDIQDEAARKERVARAAAEGQAKAQAESLKRTTLQEKINAERAKSSLPTSFMERLKQKFFPVKSLEPKTKGIVENWYTGLSKATETAQSAWRDAKAKGPQTWSEVLDYEAGKKTPYIFEAEESLYDKAKKNGIPLNHVEDHLMHIWDKKGPAVMQAAERYLKSKGLSEAEIKAYISGQPLSEAQSLRLKLRPDFSKARIFPDYKTGIKFGLRPKFRTPAQIIAYETEALDKAIANKKMIETLKSEAKLLPEDDKPDNWIPVTSRFAGRQTLYAEPRLAEFLNGRYRDEENLSLGQMLFKGMTAVTRASTHFVLTTGFPGTNIHSFGIGIGLYKPMTTAVGALAEAPIRALIGDFASSAMKIREAGTALKQTVALLRSNFTPWSKSFMEDHADDILNMSRAGIALDGRSDYYTKFGDSFWRSMVNHGGDLMGSVKELGETPGKAVKDITVTSFDTFKSAWNKFFALDKTWELMNQQKVILFGDTIRAAKRAGMDDEAALKFAADVTRKGMGIPETPNSGRSMDTEEQVTSMFIVPQYREGVMNILWNGFKGSSWKFKDQSYSFNRSLVVGAVLTYVAYNIINKKLNGHYMWDNPPGREFSIRLPQEDGSALYTDMMPSILTIPRNAAEGTFAFVKGDWATAGQKASSVLSLPLAATMNAFMNKDYFGRPIYNAADSALKKAEKVSLYWTGQQTSPAITELVKYFNGDETAAEAFTRIIQLPIRFSKATTERYSAMQDLYDSNQKLKLSGRADEANKLFNALSDADKKIYTQIKRSTEAANTTARKSDILSIYKSNQQLIADGNKAEADAIYYGLSQNDQRIYSNIKKAAQKNGK